MLPLKALLVTTTTPIGLYMTPGPGSPAYNATFHNADGVNDLLVSIDDQATFATVAPGADLVVPGPREPGAKVWLKASAGSVPWTIMTAPA